MQEILNKLLLHAAPAQNNALDALAMQVAESETFRAAPVMRILLLYLWNHRDQPINEYAVAIDALGRPSDFEPRIDATVRVHVARLRAKLNEFYAKEGVSFPLRLSVPLGGHQLEWYYTKHQPSVLARLRDAPVFYRKALLGAALVIAALAYLCIISLLENRKLKTSLPPPLPRFWRSFLQGGKPTAIVLSNPPYFWWPGRLVVRDAEISDYTNWTSSPVLRDLAKKWGVPSLNQNLFIAREVTAGIRLMQYLDKHGLQVQLIEAPHFKAELSATQNTILIGLPSTAGYLRSLMEKTNFYIASATPPELTRIRSRDSRRREPVEFTEAVFSEDRRICLAIIISLPKRPEGTRSLLVVGRYPAGAMTMLLSADGLRQLDKQWSANGSPEAWEMVVQAEIHGETVLRVQPLSFRPIPANYWN